MEVIGFKSNKKRNINKKKLVISVFIILVIIAIAVILSLYIAHKEFREWVDIKILKKSIDQNTVVSIDFEPEISNNIFAYDKYITILDKNKLNIYNSSGNLEKTLDIEISEPIFCSNNRFLAIAEKGKNKLSFINGTDIAWEKELDGNISSIQINKNGYISIIVTGTTYKSVIVVYNNEGKEMFKTYLSNTVAIDTSISNDNKYVAFAEINTSGTLIQSNVKVISMEKAQTSPAESIVYTYTADTDSLIININYQDKNNLLCMYNDKISTIINNESKTLLDLNSNDKKINFSTIEMESNYAVVYEESKGLFKADTGVDIVNASTESSSLYTLEGVAKELYTNCNVLAINIGSEIHFINNIGWLIKKYTTTQEIQNIVLTNNIAGIIYGNRVEILSL